MNKLILVSTYLLFFLTITSCGVDEELKIGRSYLSVENFLTTGDCDKALNIMESMNEQVGDANYYKLLASSYACKAGFTVTGFFANEIINIVTGPEILSGMSMFTLAQSMTDVDDLNYYYIGRAVDTLVYSGGVGPVTSNPSSSLRISRFGSYYAADINSLLLYLLFMKNGMSMAFYGNSDATGAKGAGAIGTNQCLYQYSQFGDADLNTFITTAGATGVCDNNADEGSADITNADDSLNIERACTLVTDFNNFIDVLENISTGDITDIDLATLLGDVSTTRDDFDTNVIAAKGFSANLISVKNVDECVDEFTGSELQIGYYMAAMFETLHSR